MERPKVFISYSWTDQKHQDFVRQQAERLMSDGIDVVMDVFDLREGHDKYAFMERMATDSGVTHVLAFCDRTYAEKANSRKGGVGTESQILSVEVYSKIQQSKVIPILCEYAEDGTPTLPTFFASRIYVDFSSDEAVNRNWEQLIRLLFGKPLHQKPELGKAPSYITADSRARGNHAAARFSLLRQAILEGKTGLPLYRADFIDSCIEAADKMRVRTQPTTESFAQKIVDDFASLSSLRNQLIDWVLLESRTSPSSDFSEALHELLERVCHLRNVPAEVSSYNDAWLEAHTVFVYEFFLYVVAALLKTHSWQALHLVFSNRYLVAQSHMRPELASFQIFWGSARYVVPAIVPAGHLLKSPAAKLINANANRNDLPFNDIMQAELLTLLMSFISKAKYWYPQTLYYLSHGATFALFKRAAQRRHFANIATITGVKTGDELRQIATEAYASFNVQRWDFEWDRTFADAMNLEKLDTLTQ